MTSLVHLIKLCVGCDNPSELEAWQKQRWQAEAPRHITRMWPKREAELLNGGSIYWVFKGVMLARQELRGLEEVRGEDGIARCALVLDPQLIRVAATPRRPFQGWRYLSPTDAPADLASGRAEEPNLPTEFANALAEMGLR